MADPTLDDDGVADPATRPLGRSVLVGVVIALTSAAIVYFLIAIPIYLVASFESNGMDRPIIRTGLLKVALPIGAVLGMVIGVVSGRWFRRGGSWTLDDGSDRYSNR
ncbi:hypothetical protein [Actinospongicola halichondriae]|uniref:hypothetical protein n=1 Tax=Actinospongicola halichondriae TaxID=3236844 RepID=UPI003D48719E